MGDSIVFKERKSLTDPSVSCKFAIDGEGSHFRVLKYENGTNKPMTIVADGEIIPDSNIYLLSRIGDLFIQIADGEYKPDQKGVLFERLDAFLQGHDLPMIMDRSFSLRWSINPESSYDQAKRAVGLEFLSDMLPHILFNDYCKHVGMVPVRDEKILAVLNGDYPSIDNKKPSKRAKTANPDPPRIKAITDFFKPNPKSK